jgi:superfamily I DNA and/or RNA helicase
VWSSETSKCTDVISQVKKVTEEEIIKVNSKVTEVSEELENKLERNSAQTNSVVEELTNKIIVNEAKTEDKFEKLDTKIDKADREMRQFKDTFKRNQETTPESQSFGSSYLNNSFEFRLPLFDENSDNPVFHLKQLDNYLKLRDIPAAGRSTKPCEGTLL